MFEYLIQSLDKKDKKTLSVYLIFSFFSPIIDLISVSMVIPILQKAMEHHFSQELMLQILGLGFILLLKSVFEIFKIKISNTLMRNSVVTWSTRIYELFNKEELLKHNQKTAMQQVTGVRIDTETCSRMMIDCVNIIINAIVLIGYFLLAGYVAHWTGFIFFLFIISALFVIFFSFRDKFLKFGEEKRKREIKVTSLITTTYGAYKEMKIDSRSENRLEKYKKAIEEYAQVQKKYAFISEGISVLLQNLIQAVLFFILPIFLSMEAISTPFFTELIICITLLINMLPRAAIMMLELNQIQYGWENYEIFHQNMEQYYHQKQEEEKTEKLRKKTIAFNKGLKIENLTFHYPDGEEIFEKACLEIPFGKSVAIIGSSGIGKTTFLDLILGLLTPQSGQIWYDDYELIEKKDSKGLCQLELGNIVSYIPQVVYLNGETIRNNVVFLEKGDGETQKVISCLKKAQVWNDIKKFPDGIDTLIGENGTTLSGGQRQRIALARALYKDFKFLIMDEATTGLDTKTEKEVMDSIFQLNQKTLLIVTHHLALAERCDQIYKIENKKFIRIK